MSPRLDPLHCTKCYRFSRLQPGCHLPNTPWAGIIKLFPARESDILSRDGKTGNIFLQVSGYPGVQMVSLMVSPDASHGGHLHLEYGAIPVAPWWLRCAGGSGYPGSSPGGYPGGSLEAPLVAT